MITKNRGKRGARRITVLDVTTDEAQAIRVALTQPDVRAFAITVGLLTPLSDQGRRRVMQFVHDVATERGVGNDREQSGRNGGEP